MVERIQVCRILRALAVVVPSLLAGPSIAQDDELNPDYFAADRRDYTNAFIVTVDSADPLRVKGDWCYYRYHARMREQIRGKFPKSEFDFFTNVGLTMGEDYLLLFSEREARRYHPAMDFIAFVDADATPEQQAAQRQEQIDHAKECKNAMTGYFFDYTEIHLVKNVKDHVLNTIRRMASFEFDVLQDYPASQTEHEVHEFVDLEYVKQQLNR